LRLSTPSEHSVNAYVATRRNPSLPQGSAALGTLLAGRPSLRAACLLTAVGLASALGYALGLAAAIALGGMVSATSANAGRSQLGPVAPAAQAALDPSPFILNALLVPALDGDAVPLRWVDPRPALRCGPGSVVRVNGMPLL